MAATRRFRAAGTALMWGLMVLVAWSQPSADPSLRPTIGVAHGLSGGASVNFVAPANPSAAITGYRVTAMPVSPDTGLPISGGVTTATEGASSPIVVMGLSNGTPYRFTVSALTSARAGPASIASNVMTPAASNVPALDQRMTYVLPSNVALLSDASVFGAAATELATRIGNNATLQRSKVGMSVFVQLTMPDWTVDVSNPTAVRAALAEAIGPIDAAIANANTRTPKMPIGISLITAIRERVDGVQTAAEAEDRRNVQWYQDQAKASGWVTYSQYALKLRRVQEAYVREFGRMLAERMIAHPEVLVVVTGDGETEMSFDRFRDANVPAAQRGWADYSPFAVAEFRDWLRKAGPYAGTGRLAGHAWEFAARYDGDASPGTDSNGDGHTLNGDFNQSFTTWDLRFFNYDTTSETAGLIPGSQTVTLTGGTSGGFDAPRELNIGNPWFDTWNRFRQEMIWRYNRDFARWMTVSTSAALGGIPADRWYAAQIPTDILFGNPPPDLGTRFLTSGSAHWTANIWPFGSMGVTSYNANPFEQGQAAGAIDPTKYYRTTPNIAPRAAALSPRWGIAEWNPSDPWSRDDAAGRQVYQDDVDVLLRHRPSLLMPYRMTTDSSGTVEPLYRVYNSGFEPVLKALVERVGAPRGWEPTIEWTPPAALPAGTVLSTSHLNAMANVPGTFTYSPAVGSVMPASGSTTVTATFTPSDDSYAIRSVIRTITSTSAPVMRLSATRVSFQGLKVAGVLRQLSEPLSVDVSFEGGVANQASLIAWRVQAPAGYGGFISGGSGTGPGRFVVSLSSVNDQSLSQLLLPVDFSGFDITLTVSAPLAASGTQWQTVRMTLDLSEGTVSTFTATPARLTVPAGGGSRDIAIRSTVATAPWRVSSSASWLSFNRAEGRGDGAVVVTAEPNTGAAREATVVAAGQTVTVQQDPHPSQTPPGIPGTLLISKVTIGPGGEAVLTWSAPTTGGAVTSYLVEASVYWVPFDTGGPTTLVASDIPDPVYRLTVPPGVTGAYWLRVRPVGVHGTGPGSNAVLVHLTDTPMLPPPPGKPGNVTLSSATVAPGGSVTLSWQAPVTGGTPASYVVEASGLADFSASALRVASVTETAFTIPVPADFQEGTYYLRVVAENAGGRGVESAVLTLTVRRVVETLSASVVVSGPLTARTITGSLVPRPSDLGKLGQVFVAAILPNNEYRTLFLTSGGTWVEFSTCGSAPAYSTGTLAAIDSIAIMVQPWDFSGLIGAQFYIGYGLGGVLSPRGTACTDMLSTGTYQRAYVVAP